LFFNKKVAIPLNYYYSAWLLFSFLLLIVDNYRPLSPLRVTLNKVTTPILYSVHKPAQACTELYQRWLDRKAVYEENKQLKSKQLQLEFEINRHQIILQENHYLHRLLKSTNNLRSYTITLAYLLHTNITVGTSELLIQTNNAALIQPGHIVVDDKGIIGQVIENKGRISRVLCINDTRSAVPVQINRNRLRAILVGQGPNTLLNLCYLVKTADVKVGDFLTTSGLGGRYPRGYPIARITSIEDDPTEPYLKISAAPMAALSSNGPFLILQVDPVT
jgi:rod shape-determining protein MreC